MLWSWCEQIARCSKSAYAIETMPRANTCLLQVSVEDALTLRDLGVKKKLLEFRCVECGKPVRPFSASADSAAHFEHFKRNPNCSLSDPAR